MHPFLLNRLRQRITNRGATLLALLLSMLCVGLAEAQDTRAGNLQELEVSNAPHEVSGAPVELDRERLCMVRSLSALPAP